MNVFGTRLKELRQQSGLTQVQLAQRIHVSKAAISNYELFERNPSPDILVKLAKIFHVSTDYLLGVEEKKQTLDVTGLSDEDIRTVESVIELIRKKNLSRDSRDNKERQEH